LDASAVGPPTPFSKTQPTPNAPRAGATAQPVTPAHEPFRS